ncbi:putative tRNA-dihydrouridine synthase [Asticcacaulis biprosthecium C19]|uniref:tRNA-dihydrouridine synthase n=1 Tax=Asticcacaulis biprosthecium C19 TaxID=715226 RepID=F4QQR9_9CAUL|nr:tRNA dihydrouridine synthase DusB [Asticcacaulis biprosthecium]EGF90556.1 putative tRNA-dihydrouridine synthase [Asticcacaulis biprosthecium C19]
MTKGLTIGDVTIDGRVLIAPMTGVSDLPFRRVAAKLGAPYAATEMVACADMSRPEIVRKAQLGDHAGLKIVQLVGRDPEHIAHGARLAEESGADIVDLNFGCPAKEVIGVLCGSALMRDLDQAERIMTAALKATSRPVTVKMRLGWDDDSQNAPELAQRAEKLGIKALTVHGRTRQQFYKGEANWHAVAHVKSAVRIPVIVNGDIVDLGSARDALHQSGADGLMIGRGIYGRPWFAHDLNHALNDNDMPSRDVADRADIVVEHMNDSLAFYGKALGLRMFKKHLGAYVEGAPYHDDPSVRRQDKARLCRMDDSAQIENALRTLFSR